METGEPGFSFNFGSKQNEKPIRNACTEVTSEDDSTYVILVQSILKYLVFMEFKNVVCLASKFLVCGTLRADLPYDKVYKVREK